MNSVSDIAPTSMKLLLLSSITVGLMVILSIAISGRRLQEIARSISKLMVVGVFVLVLGGFFFWVRGGTMPTRISLTSQVESPPRPPKLIETAPVTSSLSPPTSESEPVKSDVERPDWTRQPMRIDGVRKLIVVSGGKYASEAEAVLHGIEQAAASAVKEYSLLDPRGIGSVHPQHADVVKQAAIKQRFLEVTQHDFGKFQASMHELWLQVELTPELGEMLARPWRQAAVDARLRTLTGWSLWSTAVAALAAFSLRLDAAWNGRRRAAIAGTAIALTLGSLAILA